MLSRMSKRRSDDPAMRESMRKAGTLGAELPLGERLTAGVSAIWEQAKTFGREFQSGTFDAFRACLLYTSPSPRDGLLSRMPSSA